MKKTVLIAMFLCFILPAFSHSDENDDVMEIRSEIINRIELPKGYHEGLLIKGDSVYVNNGRKGRTFVVDLASGLVASTIEPIATFSEGLTEVSDGEYWLTDWDAKKIYKTKIAEGKMIEEWAMDVSPSRPTGIVWNGLKVYVITWTEGEELKFHLLEIDRNRNILKKLKMSGIPEPSQLAWDGKGLWVSSWHNGYVYRIDPSSMQVTGHFRSPVNDTTGIAWDGECFYLTGTDSDLYRIKLKE